MIHKNRWTKTVNRIEFLRLAVADLTEFGEITKNA